MVDIFSYPLYLSRNSIFVYCKIFLILNMNNNMAAEQSQQCPKLSEVVNELRRMTRIAFPIVAMGLVNYIKSMVQVISMGKLGSLELAGGALAIGFTNITGHSVLSGLALGMEPLCSQAFGSRNFLLMSKTLQKTIMMLLLVSLPISWLWINLEFLMLKIHQNPDIIRIASLYCRYAIPDLVANSFLHPLRIYLRSKGTTWPLMWCASLGLFIHIPITNYLTFALQLGVPGIALSTFITNFCTLFFLLGYVFYTHDLNNPICQPLITQIKPFTSKTSLKEDWEALLRLAIPSCLALCLEWWWYELMTLLAGYLSKPHVTLAASAIVIQTTSLMYTLPSALSASVSTRVGNELGAERPSEAYLATIVGIGLSLLTSFFGLLWTTLGRETWAKVFTKDDEVLKLTTLVLPIIGLCELANCPQTTCCGVLRGSARPSVAAAINFYSFYLVGLPVSVILAFVWKLGFLGLCYGLLSAQVSCAFLILIVVYKMDWNKESLKAKDLMGEVSYLEELDIEK